MKRPKYKALYLGAQAALAEAQAMLGRTRHDRTEYMGALAEFARAYVLPTFRPDAVGPLRVSGRDWIAYKAFLAQQARTTSPGVAAEMYTLLMWNGRPVVRVEEA